MSQSKRSSKDKYLDSLKTRYAKAIKKERGKILDEYVQTTHYHRKHAIAILSGQYQPAQRPIRRPRRRIYTVEDAKALDFVSDLFDGINAKRLRAAMDVELDALYRRGVLRVSRASYRRLKRISPASIDRLRARYGQPRAKSRHRTKPGTLLKNQIPSVRGRSGAKIVRLCRNGLGPRRRDRMAVTFDPGLYRCQNELPSASPRNKAQNTSLKRFASRAATPFPLLGMDSTRRRIHQWRTVPVLSR
jgi:hypothetical protein